MTVDLDERAKYSADDLRRMAKNGQAMSDGSYPIADEQDLRNAIRAVGRGSGSHDAIRRHIMKRARALNLTDLIPDNWMADGSMGEMNSVAELGEKRTVKFELRNDSADGDGLTLEGYAAVFNTPAAIRDRLGEYDEVIAPGAFKRTINARLPVMQFDHGQHPVLGSMPIGSITSLREDPRGLFVQARIFDNWMTEPLRQAIDAQAVDGMSFRFSVPEGKEKWTKQDNGRQLRTVTEIKLFELGPVVHPAYKETSVALRSLVDAVPGLTLTLADQDPAPVDEVDELRAQIAELTVRLETLTAQPEDADPGTADAPAADNRSTADAPAAQPDDPTPPSHSPLTTPEGRKAARDADWREIEMSRLGIGKN